MSSSSSHSTNAATTTTTSSSSSLTPHQPVRQTNVQSIVIKRNGSNRMFSSMQQSNDLNLLSPSLSLNVNECKDLFVEQQQQNEANPNDSRLNRNNQFKKVGSFIIFDSSLSNRTTTTTTTSSQQSSGDTIASTPTPSQTPSHHDLSFNTAFNLADNKSYFWKVCLILD